MKMVIRQVENKPTARIVIPGGAQWSGARIQVVSQTFRVVDVHQLPALGLDGIAYDPLAPLYGKNSRFADFVRPRRPPPGPREPNAARLAPPLRPARPPETTKPSRPPRPPSMRWCAVCQPWLASMRDLRRKGNHPMRFACALATRRQDGARSVEALSAGSLLKPIAQPSAADSRPSSCALRADGTGAVHRARELVVIARGKVAPSRSWLSEPAGAPRAAA
jgi:hypothetical protein